MTKNILHIWKIWISAIGQGFYGYENWYAPKAVVYHVGSGTSGSRYNQFKTRYSSRNNVYLIYKNMPLLQIILNLPFLAAGFLHQVFVSLLSRAWAKEYLAGIKNGFSISQQGSEKFRFRLKHLPNYCQNSAGTMDEYFCQTLHA